MTYDEYQIAEVTLRVALPTNTTTPKKRREKVITDLLRTAVEDDETLHHLSFRMVSFLRTETPEEMAERQQARTEAEHECSLEQQKERYFDRNGHF